jgi:hypothetical protein
MKSVPPRGRECANLVWIRLESALVRPFGEYKLTVTLSCKGRTSALSKPIQTKFAHSLRRGGTDFFTGPPNFPWLPSKPLTARAHARAGFDP